MALRAIYAALLGLLILPTNAVAQGRDTLPNMFEVQRVSNTGALVIHQSPDPNSSQIGTYGSDDRDIEIIRMSSDGRWGMVGLGNQNGWVRMNYLSPSHFHTYPISFNFRCVGAEPEWVFDMKSSDGDALLVSPEIEEIRPEVMWPTDVRSGFHAEFRSDRLRGNIIVGKGQCNIPGSQRVYGYSGMMIIDFGLQSGVYMGCCTADDH